ncbi:hypothetical protein PhaeoP97_00172 [Phaeobacter porticola]|uniref:Uncharacterized protein n=1 Tax=Phaeobacter porticola TaxID=1844006 RepID=A0A1L3I0Y4_9RHOB|nr:hypothetical protein PhaeoP97_00172 [Phaeobacter porticola]
MVLISAIATRAEPDLIAIALCISGTNAKMQGVVAYILLPDAIGSFATALGNSAFADQQH